MSDMSRGFIAMPDGDEDGFGSLVFGGNDWDIVDCVQGGGRAAQVLSVFDLRLPGSVSHFTEVPVINIFGLEEPVPTFEYIIIPERRRVLIEDAVRPSGELTVEDFPSLPFPRVPLRLREMKDGEVVSGDEDRSVALDSFLGGEGFIRFLGEPLYLEEGFGGVPGFVYFASIGYELYKESDCWFGNTPFYHGEFAQYFFISGDGGRVRVVNQGF